MRKPGNLAKNDEFINERASNFGYISLKANLFTICEFFTDSDPLDNFMTNIDRIIVNFAFYLFDFFILSQP